MLVIFSQLHTINQIINEEHGFIKRPLAVLYGPTTLKYVKMLSL